MTNPAHTAAIDMFFHIRFRLPGEIREWQMEGEVPETVDEVLAFLDQNDTFPVWRILRCYSDSAPADVTEIIAAVAYRRWIDGGARPGEDTPPPFIAEHAPKECDFGYPAYDIASDRAYDAMRERLADAADNLRKREKEGGK